LVLKRGSSKKKVIGGGEKGCGSPPLVVKGTRAFNEKNSVFGRKKGLIKKKKKGKGKREIILKQESQNRRPRKKGNIKRRGKKKKKAN